MAIRNITEIGASALTKRAREIDEITPRICTLLDDMTDTMREYNGVGLAAPQVGVLRRAIVVDVGEGLYQLLNPEIIEKRGRQLGEEGCLSVPGRRGIVWRPYAVKVKALDRAGNPIEIMAEGYLARAFCHEIDHLNGVLYVQHMERELKGEEKFEDVMEPDWVEGAEGKA